MIRTLRQSARAIVPALALFAAADFASAQSPEIKSTAAGFSIGAFAAGRTFRSTVNGSEQDMVNGGSGGLVIHGGFNEHHGIGLRLQGGKLDLDGEPKFSQADLTYRYTFRQPRNQFRPFLDVGVAGYTERNETVLGRFEQQAGLVTLALGGQIHFNRAVALEIVWSGAGGQITTAKLNGSKLTVDDNSLAAGGLSLGLVFHP
ncbi:MAG: hypothetical protein H7099_03410 [Gemmatimonadaceae bacterium]|nr:hypothetical protein [Gemmatimonadaceae bacterium]